MNLLTAKPTSTTSAFKKLLNDPRTKKAVAFAKDNWRDIAVVSALVLIAEDVDTAADMAETNLALDVVTRVSEGVI